MVWYSHLFQNFPQYIVIHTVKGFGTVNKTREVHKTQGLLWTDPLQSNLGPEQCRQESISCHKRAQTQRGPDAVRTPHTCHGRLFTVFLPPHNTTEQVSLDKWPPFHPCVRAEIRHWRDLQTGSQNKQRRGNCSGSNRCNRLKPVVSIN